MILMNNKHSLDYFEQRLEKGLIGPGSDSWGLPDEIEIISDYPLLRYYSGVIFPEKDFSTGKTIQSEDELKNETEEEPSGCAAGLWCSLPWTRIQSRPALHGLRRSGSTDSDQLAL